MGIAKKVKFRKVDLPLWKHSNPKMKLSRKPIRKRTPVASPVSIPKTYEPRD
jgi:hypothetical protein